MRDETAAWLNPMLDEARARRVDTHSLLMRASMPAVESDSLMANWMARNVPPGASSRALDWIRFGQILREELEWSWYPEEPQ